VETTARALPASTPVSVAAAGGTSHLNQWLVEYWPQKMLEGTGNEGHNICDSPESANHNFQQFLTG